MKVPVRAPVKAPVAAPVMAPFVAPTSGCDPAINGFTLVDADLDKDLMPLADFVVSNKNLNIRVDIAVCFPKTVVDSVLITLDGKRRCEQFEPYAVFGDNNMVDVSNDVAQYFGKIIGTGFHIITAIPYTGPKCDGIAGEAYSQKFTVRAA
jgi:hypothetical protein